jgi:hypothetical protein
MDETAPRTATGDPASDTAIGETAASGTAAGATAAGEALRSSSSPDAPSNRRIHEEQQHEEAERIAVEGDDLSEIFGSILGPERPHVGTPPPAGAPWPPPLGRSSGQPDTRSDQAGDETDENR